jgi:hypothetical protein
LVAFTAGLVGRLDRPLEAAGWVVQDTTDLNLFAGPASQSARS